MILLDVNWSYFSRVKKAILEADWTHRFFIRKREFNLQSLLHEIRPTDIYKPGVLKTGLAKTTTHSTTWQLKAIKLARRPTKLEAFI